jgi:hypothetical protein
VKSLQNPVKKANTATQGVKATSDGQITRNDGQPLNLDVLIQGP